MSNKENRFRPSTGYIVSVHQVALGVRAVAQELDIFPEVLAEACERAGFQLLPDPFDLSADAGKLIKRQNEVQAGGIHLVKESNEPSGNPGSN